MVEVFESGDSREKYRGSSAKVDSNIVRISRLNNNQLPSFHCDSLLHPVFDNITRPRHENSKSNHGHGLFAPKCPALLCLHLNRIWQNCTIQTVIIPNTIITPIACRNHLQVITSLIISILNNASPPISTLRKFYNPQKFAIIHTPVSLIKIEATRSGEKIR